MKRVFRWLKKLFWEHCLFEKKRRLTKSLSAFSFFRLNNRCYMTLITAVKTTEPTVRISIVQMTILVILENVLVCFFSRIVLPRNFIVALSLHAFSLFDKGGGL